MLVSTIICEYSNSDLKRHTGKITQLCATTKSFVNNEILDFLKEVEDFSLVNNDYYNEKLIYLEVEERTVPKHLGCL